MHDVHIGQFIGLAIAIVGGGAMYIWHTIDCLKDELKECREKAEEERDKIVDKLFAEKEKSDELRTLLKYAKWSENYNRKKVEDKSQVISNLLGYINKMGLDTEEAEGFDLEAESTGRIDYPIELFQEGK